MSSKTNEDAARIRPDAGLREEARPVVADLETSVAIAVRTAIAGTLARHASTPALPDIDMDFARDAEPPVAGPRPGRGMGIVAGLLTAALVMAAAPAVWPRLEPLLAEILKAPETGSEREPASRTASATGPIVHERGPIGKAAPQAAEPAITGPDTPASAAASPEAPPVEQARMLLSRGEVRAARDVLAKLASERDVGAILALARSYDPNFLASLPRADAAPDAGAAERLYRDWFALSVEAGHISGEAQLDRLIKSLKR